MYSYFDYAKVHIDCNALKRDLLTWLNRSQENDSYTCTDPEKHLYVYSSELEEKTPKF